MDNNQCKSCDHYLQHYALGQNRLVAVYYGHCTHLRTKSRRPDSKACEHYVPGQSPEDSFASKEYLSKALLQKVLDMALLPEIDGRG